MNGLVPGVSIVVPVKETRNAKSRLMLPSKQRRQVALALAEHSLTVAARCVTPSRVVVVTSDPDVAAMSSSLRMQVVTDPGAGLNTACESGIDEARSCTVGDVVVVMVCDLPCLTHRALAAFLTSAVRVGDAALHVADSAATGTTMVSIPPERRLPMVFGPDSAAHFRAEGCRSAYDIDPSLQFDLDTLADLWSMPATADILHHPTSPLSQILRESSGRPPAGAHQLTG